MSDREKLFELFQDINCPNIFMCNAHELQLAEYLIANGVTVQKHGRWLPCGFGKEIMCSVCGGELGDVWEYRHCPNCGAKMDKEETTP